ncbi:MAG TPA: MAPEG family protein [Candidatus Saccharimonadia bacterium]|nr:MAPEG family protein [Candidatus Saccharimonadia bacterium]
MTIAYWCVLAAGLMPFAWTAIAKASGERFNNRAPREWQARLTGMPARAHAAHLNSFEAFPLFAAAVIIAQQLQAPQGTIDLLALAFVALRVLYGVLYLADQHLLRSIVWAAAFACAVALFIVAA